MQSPRPSVAALANGVRSLLRAQRAFRRAAGTRVGGDTALQVLATLDAAGPLRAVDVAEQLGIDISGASRALSALRSAGLVERVADEHDGRNHPVALTPAGAQALHEARAAVYAEWSDALHGWTDEELEELAGNLTRLVNDLDAAGLLRASVPGAERPLERPPSPPAGRPQERPSSQSTSDREDTFA